VTLRPATIWTRRCLNVLYGLEKRNLAENYRNWHISQRISRLMSRRRHLVLQTQRAQLIRRLHHRGGTENSSRCDLPTSKHRTSMYGPSKRPMHRTTTGTTSSAVVSPDLPRRPSKTISSSRFRIADRRRIQRMKNYHMDMRNCRACFGVNGRLSGWNMGLRYLETGRIL
jgi:hypothetical protein